MTSEEFKINLLGFFEVSLIIIVSALVVANWFFALYGLYMMIPGVFLMLPCPPNAMLGTYDLPVRHCIDFSGVKDVTRVKIPDALTRFREFKFNDKLLRVSYMTARLTYCATRASFFKDGIFYKR
ncbi:MAG: hypothetical protein IPG24_25470 [Leptospiraceae bacterium]|nr:hypothetical protein [Leptospiraceae bacterium]